MRVRKVPVHIEGHGTNSTAMELTYGGHTIVTDEPTGQGGTDRGPMPFHTMLAGLAGCTHATLRLVARDLGVTVSDVRVNVNADIDPSAPLLGADVEPLETISLRVRVRTDADPAAAEQLRTQTPRRCMATRVFTAAGVTFDERWELIPLDRTGAA
jgi:uncharacterized OsmC-like protein